MLKNWYGNVKDIVRLRIFYCYINVCYIGFCIVDILMIVFYLGEYCKRF